MKIGKVELRNPVIVGPMAGISNAAFRSVAKKFKAGLIYSEMISDKALVYKNRKTEKMTYVSEEERPIALQLFGNEVESMVQAAIYLDKQTTCDIIDINMGCPVNKVVKAGSGSALLKNPDKIYEIVSQIVANVEKPVTVKIRAGWDNYTINAVEVAQVIEKAGASAIAIHPRTRSEFYQGHSNWELIKQIKQAVKIPVIGNGDITSVEDAIAIIEQTNCDAIMVARGALGNPWLIKQLADYFEKGSYEEEISVEEKFKVALEHAQKLVALKGEVGGIKEMRGHACWYIHGLPHNNRVKALFNHMKTYEDFQQILAEYAQAIEADDYDYLLCTND